MIRKAAAVLCILYSLSDASSRILLQAPPAGVVAPLACTQEVKQCPDGSFVSRSITLNCAFETCPEIIPTMPVTPAPTIRVTPAPVTPAPITPVTPSPTNPPIAVVQTTLAAPVTTNAPAIIAPVVTTKAATAAPVITSPPIIPPVVTSAPIIPPVVPPTIPATTIPAPQIPPATPGFQNTFIPQIPPIIPPPTAPITPGAPPAPVPSNIPGTATIPIVPAPVPSLLPAVPVLPINPVPVPVPVPPINGGWIPIVPTPFPTPSPPSLVPGVPGVPAPPVNANPNPAVPAPTMPRVTTPPPFVPGAYGQQCPNTQYAVYSKCPDTTAVASDGGNGRLYCNQFDADCCRCASIRCGAGLNGFGAPCTEFSVGNSGAFGVQDIVVAGDINDGAIISCYGTHSCQGAVLTGSNIESVDCTGEEACHGATMHITDPYSEFRLYCSGVRSCFGLKIVVDFTGPPPGYMCAADAVPNGVKDILQLGTIECLNEGACENMEFVMDNTGCYIVQLRNVQCVHPTACNFASFSFLGDVDVQSCELGQSGGSATGLGKCYQNLREYDCSLPSGCMGLTTTIVNPANGFELKCGNVQSCESANIRIEMDASMNRLEPIEQINGLVFGGRNSARGAVITFANAQGVDPFSGAQVVVDVDKIDCSGEGACQGARFITGANVQINEITCSNNACLNCRVQYGPMDAGQPCDPSQVTWQQQQPQPNPNPPQGGPWVQV